MKFVFVFLILLSGKVQAASCCGGGLSLPGMIVGDDRRLLSIQSTATQLREESLPSGEWSMYPKARTSQSMQLSFSQLLSDRWQAGGSTSLMHNNQDIVGDDRSNFSFGDSSLFVGYEALPEWEYSLWKPRGYVYLQLVAPTGRSTTAAILNGGGVSGRGFWTVGPGLILTKTVAEFDLMFAAEAHVSLPRTEGNVRLVPDWGASSSLGAGYLIRNYRLLTSLALNYESPVRSDTSPGTLQRFVTASFGGTYSFSDELSMTLTYADQTLFGEPINSPLNKSIALNISKRWPR